jgi:nucleoside-diphosphate-sugar epimerase
VNEMEQGKILVTGGAGFIGSGLIWALNRLGLRDILVCDQLGEDEKWLNLAPLDFDDFVTSTALVECLEADSPALREYSMGIPSGSLFGYHRTRCGISDGEQLSVHQDLV